MYQWLEPEDLNQLDPEQLEEIYLHLCLEEMVDSEEQPVYNSTYNSTIN